MEFFAKYDSPVGPVLLQSDGESLTGVYLGRPVPEETALVPVLKQAGNWLDRYFQGCPGQIDFPIRVEGTAFQQQVWRLLLRIPYGEVRTYGAIAREMAVLLGKETMSAQAVGGAVGKNPISIIIPCHRVVGAKGQLTGYAGGIHNKQWLLQHEGWSSGQNTIA